jgi:hypothetical protein
MINFIYFPQSDKLPEHLSKVVQVFKVFEREIDSESNGLSSNEVLEILREALNNVGFEVEKGKKKGEKLNFPVFFGENDRALKTFYPDAYQERTRTMIEIEAGRAVDNNEYIKDIFKALLSDVDYLVLAVRNVYRKKPDFEKVKIVIQAVYINKRINMPLKGMLLVGY